MFVPTSYFRYEGSEIVDYVCSHGYDSQTCGVTRQCPEVGRQMVEWYGTLPRQSHVRLAKRSMAISPSESPDLARMNRQ